MATNTSSNQQYSEPAPSAPNRYIIPEIVKRNQHLLVSGYVRLNNVNKQIPNEIVNLCFEWLYFDDSMTYKQLLDILLHKTCCCGVYDFQAQKWRSAVYIQHWSDLKQVLVKYINNEIVASQCIFDKFTLIQDFPINYAIHDKMRFHATRSDLEDRSNVSRTNIQKWIQRQQK